MKDCIHMNDGNLTKVKARCGKPDSEFKVLAGHRVTKDWSKVNCSKCLARR